MTVRAARVDRGLLDKDLDTYIDDADRTSTDFTNLLESTPPAFFQLVYTEDAGTSPVPETAVAGTLVWSSRASAPFNMSTESLDGFGAQFSELDTDSDISIEGSVSSGSIESIPPAWLSQDVWNLTLVL